MRTPKFKISNREVQRSPLAMVGENGKQNLLFFVSRRAATDVKNWKENLPQ